MFWLEGEGEGESTYAGHEGEGESTYAGREGEGEETYAVHKDEGEGGNRHMGDVNAGDASLVWILGY